MSVPEYALQAIMNEGKGSSGGSNQFGNFAAALPEFLQGIFNHSDRPFQKAANTYRPYFEQSKEFQQPFFDAGKSAIPGFQDWLRPQKNPSEFINNLMSNYNESPWAKFQQQQSVRASNNMGSASGLTGSTPLTQFSQQNARDISSQDMTNWLQNVLGINTNYGSGLEHLMERGQTAGNNLSNMYDRAGSNFGNLAYNEEQGKINDRNSIFSSLSKFFGD